MNGVLPIYAKNGRELDRVGEFFLPPEGGLWADFVFIKRSLVSPAVDAHRGPTARAPAMGQMSESRRLERGYSLAPARQGWRGNLDHVASRIGEALVKNLRIQVDGAWTLDGST